jgi:cytochrome P450
MTYVPTPDSPEICRRERFDPPENYEKLRDTGELGKFKFPSGREAWMVTAYQDVTAILADKRFSSGVNMMRDVVSEGDTPGWLFGMDAPEHTQYRRLLTGQLTMHAMQKVEPRIERIVRERIRAIEAAGAPADLFKEFAWPLPTLVLADLLGIPLEEQKAFEQQLATLDEPGSSREARRAGIRDAWGYVLSLVRRRMQRPADDFISELLRRRPEDSPASAEECASVILSLWLGGHAPVSHVLAMSVFALLANGRRFPAADKDKRRLDAAVDELLRYIPSNNLGVIRTAVEAVPIAGATIQAGDPVFASLPVANRDPSKFLAPDTLDLERGFSSHLAFGHGTHHCPGQNLARVELRVALTELFRTFPALRLAVEPEQIPMENSTNTYSVTELPVMW